VYIASSLSHVNNNRGVIGILNSNKKVITVTNLKVSATQCIDPVSVQKVESSALDSTEIFYHRKDGLGNSLETTIWRSVMLNL